MPRSCFAVALSLSLSLLLVGCGPAAAPSAPAQGERPPPAVDPIDDPVGDDPVGDDPVPPVGDDEDDACEPDVVCIEALPFTAEGSTAEGSLRFDSYSCGPQDESGPERIYRVTLPSAGTLVVELDDALEDGTNEDGSPVDVDVHILTALDADACVARGDRRAFTSTAVGDDAQALTLYVVLDSFVFSDGSNGAGAFAAAIVFSAAGDEDDAVQTHLVAAGVAPDVATFAARAWDNAALQDLTDSTVYSVIDFSLPSTQRRLWIVDVATGALLVNDRVAHGSGSNSAGDAAMADSFSNTSGSLQSSLGLARTAETYEGSNGYSLRLDGLEASNDRMRDRAIVMHGAAYAEDSFVEENGYLGRSNGCPAVAMSRSADIIDLVKEGTLVFSYFPDADWLSSSEFLD